MLLIALGGFGQIAHLHPNRIECALDKMMVHEQVRLDIMIAPDACITSQSTMLLDVHWPSAVCRGTTGHDDIEPCVLYTLAMHVQ